MNILGTILNITPKNDDVITLINGSLRASF